MPMEDKQLDEREHGRFCQAVLCLCTCPLDSGARGQGPGLLLKTFSNVRGCVSFHSSLLKQGILSQLISKFISSAGLNENELFK